VCHEIFSVRLYNFFSFCLTAWCYCLLLLMLLADRSFGSGDDDVDAVAAVVIVLGEKFLPAFFRRRLCFVPIACLLARLPDDNSQTN